MKSHTVTRWGTAAIAGALMICLASSANAQGGGNRMTPEQRQQFAAQLETQRTQAREDWLRQAMMAAGLTDPTTQTAVIELGKKQTAAKVTLQEKARALSVLIAAPTTPDATLKTELAAFRAAVAAYEAQQATDLAALDAQVKYTTTPRIDGLLTLIGILGDETTTLGGVGAIFPESPYGNARGGRGQGGGQRGRGAGAAGADGQAAGQAGQGRNRNRNRNQAGGNAAGGATNPIAG